LNQHVDNACCLWSTALSSYKISKAVVSLGY
jgi:hypothetical protein